MTTLLIGERWNMKERQFLYDLWDKDSDKYLEVMLSFGGLVRNRRLGYLGIYPHSSMNLLPPAPQDVQWNRALADDVARLCSSALLPKHDLVWLCGRRVAAAFRIPHDAEWGDTVEKHGTHIQILPHPSGLNRFWNNEDLTQELRVDVEQAIRMYGGGHCPGQALRSS